MQTRGEVELTAWQGHNSGLQKCFAGRTVLETFQLSDSIALLSAKNLEESRHFGMY